MCTVTIVQSPGWDGKAFRMACSRDESHGRSPATEPEYRTVNGVKALMPVDPGSGGTWVGVNEFGVALTLLNHNLPEPPTGRDQSRGQVIPALLHVPSVEEIVPQISAIKRERMMPFRLVACDGRYVLLWRGIDPVEKAELSPWDGKPLMFTSSGLGDHLVEPPRRELFDGWFSGDPVKAIQEQEAFHRHQWPGREHLSVCMHREDARTVSYTTVDVSPPGVTMFYHPDRPDREATESGGTLTPGLARP